jgi:hypothetical protein
MEPNRKKELTIFLTALAVIAVTFGGGVLYLKGAAGAGTTGGAGSTSGAGSGLLADISANVPVTASTTVATTTTTTATAKATSSVATSTAKTSTAKTSPHATSTSTPAKPAPAKSAAPASTASTSTPAKPVPATPLALTLPYTETTFIGDKNWHATWGTFAISTSTNELTVESAKTTTGATVLLSNSTAWTNYQFDATVDWTRGEMFGLIARYINGKNYTLCSFYEPDQGDVQVTLEQYVNGQENDLAQGSITNYEPAQGSFVDAYIKVYNTEGVCSLDGHQISNDAPNAYVINAPFSGGIGFTMWDPTTDNTEATVKSVSVAPAVN